MKRMLSFLLATFLLITCVGCSNPTDISKESNVEQPKQENITTQKFNNVIDEKIFNYLENNCSYSDENYIFSPLSFKYALSLANYGANGTTQDELINATGFYNVENNLLWTSNINNFVKEYNETAQKDFEETHKYFPELNSPSRTISVANSIWHNLDSDGKIKDDYIKYSENNFNSKCL